jgi:hypothetical protein
LLGGLAGFSTVAPDVDEQDLQGAGDWERAERAGDLGADQDRDEHHQRRQLNAAPVHERLQDVGFRVAGEGRST